ncbi:MAG: restriction endonuclease [Burkholderiales bacterium]
MSLPSGPLWRQLRHAAFALVWIGLAVFVYLARAELVDVLRPHAAALALPAEWLRWALAAGPHVLALGCGLLAAWQVAKVRAASGAPAAARGAEEADWIRRLGWMQFEQLVESHFTHRGLRTVLLRGEPGCPPRTGTIDGGGVVQVLHCTEWKSEEIGYEIVNAFASEIAARSAQGGVLLTFGRLTRGASTLAADKNIEVVSGIKLTRMLRASGWESSRLESGGSTGFGNSRSPDSRHSR